MNRVKALAADAALYPVWIAFLILFLIWRLRVRVAASPPASTTDAWLDAADHEHQRRATCRGDLR